MIFPSRITSLITLRANSEEQGDERHQGQGVPTTGSNSVGVISFLGQELFPDTFACAHASGKSKGRIYFINLYLLGLISAFISS